VSSRTYDRDALNKAFLGKWDGDNFYLFHYTPAWRGGDEATRLILDFKEGRTDAVELAIELVSCVMLVYERILRPENVTYILSAPSHRAGKPNWAGEQLCEGVARAIPWIRHIRGGLERTETVIKSATAPPGERPDYGTHLRTIRYVGPQVLKSRTVILFDDILTRGCTSQACKDILRKKGFVNVFGIFLGRTR